MKFVLITIFNILMIPGILFGQQRKNPVVRNFGGIYDIREALVKPEPNQHYKIVIDIVSGAESPHKLNPALNNVARLLNLHAVGGVPRKNLDVVLAIHGGATVAVLKNEAYIREYEMANPNILLLEALKEAGVMLTVCGQSLIGRGIETSEVLDPVEIATSMLTTMTTYQLKGYVPLQF